MDDKPFRWNLREQRALRAMLARALDPALTKITIPKQYQQTYGAALSKQHLQKLQTDKFRTEMAKAQKEAHRHSQDLLKCCARIISLMGHCDLVFVGRSPEPIFDHLSGLLYDTTYKSRLTLFHYSNARYINEVIDWKRAVLALKKYLVAIQLDPKTILKRKRCIAFVDIADSGSTFYDLITFYENWSDCLGLDWKQVRSKIRILGIVGRQKTSPKAYRWHQEGKCRNLLDINAIKNTSVTSKFLVYLGSWSAHKASVSFSSRYWGVETAYVPTRTDTTLIGLQLALDWFELGRTDERRQMFAKELSGQAEMKDSEIRNLVLQLRKTAKPPKAKKSGRQIQPV